MLRPQVAESSVYVGGVMDTVRLYDAVVRLPDGCAKSLSTRIPRSGSILAREPKLPKSDLRNHEAIVQPRLYDAVVRFHDGYAHDSSSCQGHSYGKVAEQALDA